MKRQKWWHLEHRTEEGRTQFACDLTGVDPERWTITPLPRAPKDGEVWNGTKLARCPVAGAQLRKAQARSRATPRVQAYVRDVLMALIPGLEITPEQMEEFFPDLDGG